MPAYLNIANLLKGKLPVSEECFTKSQYERSPTRREACSTVGWPVLRKKHFRVRQWEKSCGEGSWRFVHVAVDDIINHPFYHPTDN